MKEQIKDKSSIMLVGIEAHVCILQTALDALESDLDVHILVDGVSSMQAYDRKFAFEVLSCASLFSN